MVRLWAKLIAPVLTRAPIISAPNATPPNVQVLTLLISYFLSTWECFPLRQSLYRRSARIRLLDLAYAVSFAIVHRLSFSF
jgi:hypothetical protein